MDIVAAVVVGLLAGAVASALVARLLYAARSASALTERDLLRQRVEDLETALAEDAQTASVLAPLRDTLGRVERQVGTLERERTEQFAALGERLGTVTQSTDALRSQTAALAGSLSASSARGLWGEMQLRRILEHAGLLSRCDFEEQVRGVNDIGASVRPDVVVHLPGEKSLVVDAKVPLSAYLAAQADGLDPDERTRLLREHAAALRGHVDALAAKRYWSALPTAPELVVCFLPSDAVLAAALRDQPELFDRAVERRVVLAGPSTLVATLRTVALTWQQDALADGARELLDLGRTLYERLSGLGRHAVRLGSSLQRSVEAYNAMVGSLESRVFVTARRIEELGLVQADLPVLAPLETAPRPLTATELIAALDRDVGREELDLSTPKRATPDRWPSDVGAARRDTA